MMGNLILVLLVVLAVCSHVKLGATGSILVAVACLMATIAVIVIRTRQSRSGRTEGPINRKQALWTTLVAIVGGIAFTILSGRIVYAVRAGSEILYRGFPYPMAVHTPSGRVWIYDQPLFFLFDICVWALFVRALIVLSLLALSRLVRPRRTA